LRRQDIKVELVQDQASQDSALISEDRPLLRLWSKDSSDYWRKTMRESDDTAGLGLTKGLLIRIDPNVPLPTGINPSRIFDLIDLNSPNNAASTEQLVSTVSNWLSTGELNTPIKETNKPETEIDGLLQELNNLETRPRRRLEIGDRLAELGDPRKGVGIREYEILEYPPEIQHLMNELDDIKTEPPRRLAIGNRLAELDDPRPGVGLDERGLPDIDWVEIPAGPFLFGEKDRQQTIELERFYISRYPITHAQYQAFIEAGGYRDERWWVDLIQPEPKESYWQQANRPRETVDWYEAVAFTRWLWAQLGGAVTLPTEAQWEKAARGTDGRAYPWGNAFQSGSANLDETLKKSGLYTLGETTAVGLYPQGDSPFGVADMAGNVWEWCLNKYETPDQLEPDASGDPRVVRGGSWFHDPELARSAFRFRVSPDYRYYSIGFRVVSSSPFTGR
jgi:hypothetical protein